MGSIRQLFCVSALAVLAVAAPSKLKKRDALPAYALTYSPYSYLNSAEQWFPSDITTHLQNTIPEVNFVPIGAEGSVTLATLNNYNTSVYLSSSNPGSDNAAWQYSTYGKPSNGYSAAPGTIIAVQKNATWVDVFYFYFYSYNYGGK